MDGIASKVATAIELFEGAIDGVYGLLVPFLNAITEPAGSTNRGIGSFVLSIIAGSAESISFMAFEGGVA